ncbi:MULTISPECIES: hypothetical protein [Pseudomonas syringae group]|uniref:Uncharacterized protein n=1 Tax=Pseudomonas syringae pv. ribicola TaxID=55398 RepID=A0A3M2VM59_PSESI|nr:hypothetical protein [Pseudomonas syringae group genomosp. 3]RML40359.1 hypothetical protein ALQ95_03450 [Pseudomonas syringae pv. ribicola]
MNRSTLASKAPTEFESKHLITIDPDLEVQAVNFNLRFRLDGGEQKFELGRAPESFQQRPHRPPVAI